MLLIFSSSQLFIYNVFLVYLIFFNVACLSVLIKDLLYAPLYLLSILCIQHVFSYPTRPINMVGFYVYKNVNIKTEHCMKSYL
jgi:hypothetical protein